MSNKINDSNLKEKLRQALSSTARAISDDFDKKIIDKENKSSKKFDFFELDNLSTKSDFVKARANYDSIALKKKFSDENIYKKNLPINSSYKTLYSIAEKIRYETLGGKMLKGIKKNLSENYNQMINLKRKDQLKSKEDVPVSEAFELYMLKKFHNIELNSLTSKMLDFWEEDFNQSIENHIDFFKSNLENQDNYSSKFSEIFEQMNIFQNEDQDDAKEENQEDGQNNPSNEDQESENEDKKEQNKDDETQASLDSEYDIDEYKLDEQLVDTDSDKQSKEEVIQKRNLNKLNWHGGFYRKDIGYKVLK